MYKANKPNLQLDPVVILPGKFATNTSSSYCGDRRAKALSIKQRGNWHLFAGPHIFPLFYYMILGSNIFLVLYLLWKSSCNVGV